MNLLYEPLDPSSGRPRDDFAAVIKPSLQRLHAKSGVGRLWGHVAGFGSVRRELRK